MATSSTYYLNAPSLASATAVFSDAAMTTFAADGFYSNGVISRQQIDGVLLPQQTCPSCGPVSYNCVSGTCIDPGDGTGTYETLESCQAACTAPETVRLDWWLGNQPGGELIVFNNSMSELLNVTSTGARERSGTIYVLESDLPYTIRGQWVSGSGNIIHFNVCDIIGGGTIYTSGDIDNMVGYEDYVVSPTPNHALVQLTAYNVTPPTCPI